MTVTYEGGAVAKAYLGGGRYAPAVALGAKELRTTVRAGMYKPRGPSKRERMAARAARETSQSIKSVRDQAVSIYGPKAVKQTKNARGLPVEQVDINEMSTPLSGIARQAGGRKGERQFIANSAYIPPGSRKALETHEMAHVGPKRSGYRLAQIGLSPKKLAREEARADMAAGQYYRRKVKDFRRNKPMAIQSSSAYSIGAANPSRAIQSRYQYRALGLPSMEGVFRSQSMQTYRNTQNKIARAQGVNATRGRNKPREVAKAYLGGGKYAPATALGARKGYQMERVHKAILKPLKPPAMGIKTPKAPKPFTGVKLPSLKPKKPAGVKLPQLPKPPRPGY